MVALLIKEAASQGIDAATATLIAGVLAVVGTVLGTLAGLLGERWLRGRGEIRCRLVGLEQLADLTRVIGSGESSPGQTVPEISDKLMDDSRLGIHYTVKWRMFNE